MTAFLDTVVLIAVACAPLLLAIYLWWIVQGEKYHGSDDQ